MPSSDPAPERPERTFSEGLVLPDGRKVRILAYDNGSVRMRLDGAPYVMAEAFLSGGANDHAIVKLIPHTTPQESELARTCQICGLVAESIPGVRRHARHHLKKGGLTRGANHVQFWVNAWKDDANGTIQMASPRDQANFRAVLKPDSYLGGKILALLEEPEDGADVSDEDIAPAE